MVSYYQATIFKLIDDGSRKDYLVLRVIKAKRFIENHFSASLDLEQISREACLSKFHFLRLFKSCYGYTPHQFLISVRIEKAKHLLKLGLSLSAACHLVGFESKTSFIGLFKKITGSTPVAYQKQF